MVSIIEGYMGTLLEIITVIIAIVIITTIATELIECEFKLM